MFTLYQRALRRQENHTGQGFVLFTFKKDQERLCWRDFYDGWSEDHDLKSGASHIGQVFCHTYRPLERSDTEVLISYGLLVMY